MPSLDLLKYFKAQQIQELEISKQKLQMGIPRSMELWILMILGGIFILEFQEMAYSITNQKQRMGVVKEVLQLSRIIIMRSQRNIYLKKKKRQILNMQSNKEEEVQPRIKSESYLWILIFAFLDLLTYITNTN